MVMVKVMPKLTRAPIVCCLQGLISDMATILCNDSVFEPAPGTCKDLVVYRLGNG